MKITEITYKVASEIKGGARFGLEEFFKDALPGSHLDFAHQNFFYSYPAFRKKWDNGKDFEFHRVETHCLCCDYKPERNYGGYGSLNLYFVDNTDNPERAILLCNKCLKVYQARHESRIKLGKYIPHENKQVKKGTPSDQSANEIKKSDQSQSKTTIYSGSEKPGGKLTKTTVIDGYTYNEHGVLISGYESIALKHGKYSLTLNSAKNTKGWICAGNFIGDKQGYTYGGSISDFGHHNKNKAIFIAIYQGIQACYKETELPFKTYLINEAEKYKEGALSNPEPDIIQSKTTVLATTKKGYYAGNKNRHGIGQKVLNEIPAHTTYYELFAGHAGIASLLPVSSGKVINDCSGSVVSWLKKNYKGGGDIIQMDAIALLRSLNKKDKTNFIFLDPPYLLQTRLNTLDLYEHEMNDRDHIQLLTAVLQLKCNCMIIHPVCDLYENMLSKWRKVLIKVRYHTKTSIECLYMNYDPPQKLQTYEKLGKDCWDRQRIQRKSKALIKKYEALPVLEREYILNELFKKFRK